MIQKLYQAAVAVACEVLKTKLMQSIALAHRPMISALGLQTLASSPS